MSDHTTAEPWKNNPTLIFDGGTISIRLSGYGDSNGDGFFTFDEDDAEQHPHSDKVGSYFTVKIAKSEMLEIRNWLTDQLKKAQDE